METARRQYGIIAWTLGLQTGDLDQLGVGPREGTFRHLSSSHPVAQVMGRRCVTMAAAVDSVGHRYLTSASVKIPYCPSLHIIAPGFSPPFSSPSTLNCSLERDLGRGVLMYYMPKPGKLFAFRNDWQKWFLIARIWTYRITNIDICFVFHAPYAQFL